MNPDRFEWKIRCEFNAYCKQVLRNELKDALRERKRRSRREVSFSDLTPHEENQLYTVDKYFDSPDKEEAFCAGGLKISAKLLAAFPCHRSRNQRRPRRHENCCAALSKLHSLSLYAENP